MISSLGLTLQQNPHPWLVSSLYLSVSFLQIRGTNLSQGLCYDLEHEILRRKQLTLLHGRSKDEVEEEERLVAELERIEARRRAREKKQQDLQKILNQAEQLDNAGAFDETMSTTGSRRGTQSGMGQSERRKSTVDGFPARVPGGSLGASLASTATAVTTTLVGLLSGATYKIYVGFMVPTIDNVFKEGDVYLNSR